MLDPANVVHDDLRTRHGELKPLAAHRFDEHAEVQFATAGNAKFVRITRIVYAQCHIVLELLVEAFPDLAARQELAVLTGEWRLVDLEGHAHGRFVDGQRGQGLFMVRVAERVRDAQLVDAAEHNDVAGRGTFRAYAFEAVESKKLEDAGAARRPVRCNDADGRIGLQCAPANAPDTENTDIRVVVQARHLQLQRPVCIHIGVWDVLYDRFKKRGHIAAADIRVITGVSFQGRRINNREIELLVGRAEPIEQVECLVDYPVGASAFAIDFVDDHDWHEPLRKRFLRDEAGLGHRAFDGVDEEEDAVDHREHAFHFATKIRVSRRVHNVDAIILPVDGRVLRQDSNASLAFEIAGVHDSIGYVSTRAQGARLLQHPVDQGRFAMVNMSDDRNIAKF